MPTPVDPRRTDAPKFSDAELAALDAAEAEASSPATLAALGRAARVAAGLDAATGADAADANAASTLVSSQPELPEAAESPASPAQARGFLSMLGGSSDYSAFYVIQQGQMKALALAATLRRNAQAGVTTASFQSVQDMVAQIKGERRSATFQLAGSLLGAASSTVAAAYGSRLRSAGADAARAFGAGLDSAGAQLGSAVSGAVNLVDKATGLGGEYKAQQARLAMKVDEVNKSLAQQIADGARSAYDQADKALSNAMQAFSDYFKRKESLMGNIANQ